jgi:tripartite-type tricarboxylate transporter receptor subunit TctC
MEGAQFVVSSRMRLVARLAKLIVTALPLAWFGAASAQPWPSQPIALVAAFPAGSTSDHAARAIAHGLSSVLGQPVVVENRPGSGGAIALAAVAKAAPDGYTLVVTAIGPAVLRPLIDQKVTYDALNDFTPIALIGETPNVLVTGPKSRFSSVQDVVTFAKRNPGRLTIGHPGAGTMGHLTALLFAAEAGISANFVAYQGAPPILSDLVGEHIDLGSIAYGGGVGAVRILAVTTEERPPFLPDVPTMKESDFPNVVASTWHAVLAPAGLAPDVVSTLNRAINSFLNKEETRMQFDAVGYGRLGGTPERLRARIAADRAKWSAVIRSAKIAVDH